MATFNVYVPSYKRYDEIYTANCLEYCTYVVRKSEEELYRNAGICDVIGVEDDLIDSEFKVIQWIISNTKEDIICILDDDIVDFCYRKKDVENFEKNKEKASAELERIAQLVLDLGIGLACIDVNSIPYNYNAEFNFAGISDPIKWINKKVFKAKFDKNVEFNYDIDLVLQELLVNRIVLKPKYLCTKCFIDTNKGGSSSKRRQQQVDSINNMKLKWGKHFDFDFNKNKPKINVKR